MHTYKFLQRPFAVKSKFVGWLKQVFSLFFPNQIYCFLLVLSAFTSVGGDLAPAYDLTTRYKRLVNFFFKAIFQSLL